MYVVINKDLVVDRAKVVAVTGVEAAAGRRHRPGGDGSPRTAIILEDGRRLLTRLRREAVVRRLESVK